MALLIDALGEAADYFEREGVVGATRDVIMEAIAVVLKFRGVNCVPEDWSFVEKGEDAGVIRRDISTLTQYTILAKRSRGLDVESMRAAKLTPEQQADPTVLAGFMKPRMALDVEGAMAANEMVQHHAHTRAIRDAWDGFFAEHFPDSKVVFTTVAEVAIRRRTEWRKRGRRS
jgi:hypothetical protein